MLFTESFITDAGSRLFARAAAQEGRIVWTRAATSSLPSDNHQTSQMNALNEATFGTKTSSGVVTNALVNDQQNTASIYAELTNEEYDGEARTFGAWAKIEGDNTDVLVIVARCGTGVTPTTINPASAGVVKAFVDFEIDITAEQVQAVQVSEGWYATQAALQDEIEARESLAGRVVTTHKAGDINSGDDQAIYGEKTFVDTVKTNNIKANTDLLVSTKVAQYVSSKNISDPFNNPPYTKITTAYNGMTFRVVVNETRDYVIQFYEASNETAVLCPAGCSIDLGMNSNDRKWRNVYANNFNGNLNGNVTGNLTGNVTGNLTGMIPTADSSENPVGSIFLVFLKPKDLIASKGIGECVTSTYYHIHKAEFRLNSNGIVSAYYSDSTEIEDGTYKLLSGIKSLATDETSVALVMRIS